jgi:hypothetical protein
MRCRPKRVCSYAVVSAAMVALPCAEYPSFDLLELRRRARQTPDFRE